MYWHELSFRLLMATHLWRLSLLFYFLSHSKQVKRASYADRLTHSCRHAQSEKKKVMRTNRLLRGRQHWHNNMCLIFVPISQLEHDRWEPLDIKRRKFYYHLSTHYFHDQPRISYPDFDGTGKPTSLWRPWRRACRMMRGQLGLAGAIVLFLCLCFSWSIT